MAFLTESEPVRGVLLPSASGISRIVARNPGAMTYHGTNTYLIAQPDGTSIVLDPGPDDAEHVAAILDAAGRVSAILLSHTHVDHIGALASLRAATGAPVHAFSRAIAPDHVLQDGDEVAGLTVLHTPGHASDHVCFARADGVVFSADHIMGWSTSLVSEPDGDMAAYFASLERMLTRSDSLYLPGHGPGISDPAGHAQFLLDHRRGREAAVLAVLADGPADIDAIVTQLYQGLAERLRPAAARSVHAHLVKLATEGRAVAQAGEWAIP
jgi:glyoxylase-like metal-dependent hydrolase (beta-lactamase superfamily II)